MSGFKPCRRLSRSRQGFHTSLVANGKVSIFRKSDFFRLLLRKKYNKFCKNYKEVAKNFFQRFFIIGINNKQLREI